jgi:hypothetical protein
LTRDLRGVEVWWVVLGEHFSFRHGGGLCEVDVDREFGIVVLGSRGVLCCVNEDVA